MTRILITGIGGPAGRNVAQLLLARGYDLVGTDMRPVEMPGVTFRLVPAANAADFLKQLQRLVIQEQIDLLIPTVTEELPIVADCWHTLSDVPAMIGSGPAVSIANDKYLTARYLATHGVTVPRFCLPSQIHSAADLATAVGWPCLSKPRVGRGGRGIVVWQAGDYARLATLDDQSILQEFMPGTDYAPNLCLGRDGQATIIVLEKTRLREGNVGNAAEVQRVAASDVAQLAGAAAESLGFTGPLDIDIRRRRDHAPAVLEINARFGANIAHAPEVLDAALANWGVA